MIMNKNKTMEQWMMNKTKNEQWMMNKNKNGN